MRQILRVISVGMVGLAALWTAGCECQQSTDENGNTISVCESLERFNGTPVTRSLSYEDGTDILVEGVNGNIDITSGGDTVEVTFQPFSSRGHSNEDAAERDIEDDLVLETDDSGKLHIRVSRASGASSGLGADMTIRLPSSYTGGVTIDAGNGYVTAALAGTQASTTVKNDGSGDLEISGAAGALAIEGGFDIDVSVASWGASGEDGTITCTGSLGEVAVSVPADADGLMTATSRDESVVVAEEPAGWVIDESSSSSKSFTFGAGQGANVVVSGDKQITVNAN